MGQDALFGRGEAGERTATGSGDNSPVEHGHRPEARAEERPPPTVVFAFETAEQRAELVSLLGLRVRGRAGAGEAFYPPDAEDEAEMTFGF